jgi:2-aminoethylphosphonate-pyruvate transaminase
LAAPDARAIILAAGMGTRLRSVVDGRPKGLIEIDGETLVGRSVRVLGDAGVADVTIVVGHCADQYERFAAGQPGVRTVVNERFASSGSMASLARALDAGVAGGDLVVLESDIVYEARALTAILSSSSPDATLLSGPTRAGDEVWVCAPNGRVQRMSKRATELPSIAGEFVGITRLSAEGALAMRHAFGGFVTRFGHEHMDYETGALVAVAARHAIAAVLVPDLVWGEIDDERHFARVTGDVWPRLQAMRTAG